jgi:lysophospholipase L1-like esterase
MPVLAGRRGLLSPARPFDPTRLPGLAARWLASDAYTDAAGTTPARNAGDVVRLVRERVGGFDLTVQGADAPPTFNPALGYLGSTNGGTFPNANPFGGPAVVFNGTSQALANTAFNAVTNTSNPVTVAVCARALTGGSFGPAFGLGTGNQMVVTMSRAGGDTANTNVPSGGGVTYNPNFTDCGRGLVWAYDPSQGTFAAKGRLYEFGAQVTPTGSFYGTGNAIPAGAWLGRNATPTWFAGGVMEVCVWDRALTDAECLQVENYWGTQYLRRGFSHLYCAGDSITRGYPSSQNDDPASYGTGSGSSYPLKLWFLVGGGSVPGNMWSTYDGGNVAYSVKSPAPAGTAGSIQSVSGLFPSYRDPWGTDVVIFEGGTNDIGGGGQTDAATITALQTALTAFQGKGFAKVILWTIPRRGDWPLGQGPYGGISGGTWGDGQEAYRVGTNNWITGSAVSGGYCTAVFDTDAAGLTNPGDGVYYTADKLHLTNAGYSRVAQALVPLVC